jgi:hypothetical protein
MARRPSTPSAAIGRALFALAAVISVLALLTWMRVLPLTPESRLVIISLLMGVALLDVLVGWWFVSRSE